MKKIWLIVFLLWSVRGFAEDLKDTATFRIGYVDFPGIIDRLDEGRTAKDSLKTKYDTWQKTIQTKMQSFDKDRMAYEKQRANLSTDARQKKETDLAKQSQEIQELMSQANMNMQTEEQKVMQPIIEKLKVVSAEVAQKKGFRSIETKSELTVFYSHPADDVTQDVAKAYNERYKSAEPGKKSGG